MTNLLPGRKTMTNLDIMLKSRNITLLTKVHIVKATVFPLVMYGCESWIIKKAEHQRIDALELWCWRRLLRVPWTARSNQSILNEINPQYSLERLMLKWTLQYFGHLIWRANSLRRPWCWERLRAGGKGGYWGWAGWMASPTQWSWVWENWQIVKDREAWHAVVHGVAKIRTWLNYWKTTNEREKDKSEAIKEVAKHRKLFLWLVF